MIFQVTPINKICDLKYKFFGNKLNELYSYKIDVSHNILNENSHVLRTKAKTPPVKPVSAIKSKRFPRKKHPFAANATFFWRLADWLPLAVRIPFSPLKSIGQRASRTRHSLSLRAPSILLVNKISLALRQRQAAWHFYAIFASICMCHQNSHNSFRGRRVQLRLGWHVPHLKGC